MTSTATHRSPAISVEGLVHHYGDEVAVRGIDLEVDRGEIFALLGTNGAGKTTTLEIIQGYREPTSGRVSVLGLDPVRDGREMRSRTGFMLQDAGFYPELSAGETLDLWARLSSREGDVDETLEAVGLAHRSAVRVDQLSGGERRRLDLALAIWGGPDLVVLDEPTTGLDPESRRTLWSLVTDLRDAGTTVVLTTHYLDEAQALADTVAIMHAGEVAIQGDLDEILAHQPTLARAVVTPAVAGEVAERLAPRWVLRQDALEGELDDVHADIAELLRAVSDRGGHVDDLTVNRPGLDELFHALRSGHPTARQGAVS